MLSYNFIALISKDSNKKKKKKIGRNAVKYIYNTKFGYFLLCGD